MSDPVRRTREIEDPTNLIVVHAISNRLTPLLARFGVRPNTVSLAGMTCGLAAGIAYYDVGHAASVVAGFLLMLAWHVLDGTDGQLARLTGAQSEVGKILDGICDYVTFSAVYVALALQLVRQDGAWVWLVVVLAGLCHAFQSAAYERQRQDYDHYGWGRRVDPGARPDDRASASIPSPSRAFRMLHAIYARVQSVTIVTPTDRARLDNLLRADPAAVAALRRRYRETFAGPIRRWSILSANTRTLGLFVFGILDRPLLYFASEIVVLSLVLTVLAVGQRFRFGRFVEAERVPA